MIKKTAKFGVFVVPAANGGGHVTKPAPMMLSSKKSHPALDIPETMPVLKTFAELNDNVDLRNLTSAEDIFSGLYRHYTSENTYSISLQERKFINSDKSNPLYKVNSLTYGEINDLQCLRNVFAYLHEHNLMPADISNSVFYDLGSGSGRVLVAAALLTPFAKCVGVEILASLHGIAKIVKEEYDKFFASPVLEVYHGSITDLTIKDWTDGDVIYVNCVCFPEDLFQEMAQIAARLKIGTIVVTLAQPLPKSAGFRLLHETREQMSWGEADFLIQQKIK